MKRSRILCWFLKILSSLLALSILISFPKNIVLADVLPGMPSPIPESDLKYTELVHRADYSIFVPSTTEDGLWRNAYLYLHLDQYDIRVDRYRNAFVAAIIQPELTAKMQTDLENFNNLRDFAKEAAKAPGISADLLKLVTFLSSPSGFFDFNCASIQTTLNNWKAIVRNKHVGNALGKFGTTLKGVGFIATVNSDVLDEMFIHAVINGMAMERLSVFKDFVSQNQNIDPAIAEGLFLAEADVNTFIDQDFSLVASTLHSIGSHPVELTHFLLTFATQFQIIRDIIPSTALKIVWPYYLSYKLGVGILSDIVDLQSMCCAATINNLLRDWILNLEHSFPNVSDPAYDDARREYLKGWQITYGTAYWYSAKYEEILEFHPFDLTDWIRAIVQFGRQIGHWGIIEEFRGNLRTSMARNYDYTILIRPYLNSKSDLTSQPVELLMPTVSPDQGNASTIQWVFSVKYRDPFGANPTSIFLDFDSHCTLMLPSGVKDDSGAQFACLLGHINEGEYRYSFIAQTPYSATPIVLGPFILSVGAAQSITLGAWAWGDNTSGKLGDGSATGRSSPVQVYGLSGIVALSGGYNHSLGLKSDGTLWWS